MIPAKEHNQVYTIGLPNGRSCTIPTYLKAWRTLLGCKPDAQISGFGHFPERADAVLRRLREGMHDRINQNIPGHGVGRRWSSDWYLTAWRLSRDLNTPHLVVRINQVPPEYRARLAHRLDDES